MTVTVTGKSELHLLLLNQMADHPKLAPRSTEDIENQMLVDKAECKISVNVVDFYHNNRMVVIETQEINEVQFQDIFK